MQEADLEVKDGYIQYSSADYRSGYDRMNALLDLEERPTAVFCSDDAIASYAVRAALDRGLRVPEDISIMGFDNQRIFTGSIQRTGNYNSRAAVVHNRNGQYPIGE